MDRLLGTLISRVLRRGLRGEPVWLAVGVGAWLLRRARQGTDAPIWSGRVSPGDRLVISTIDPLGQRDATPTGG